jgi:NADP-dependent 3-hydroxy acid dehydrogenase YdfG
VEGGVGGHVLKDRRDRDLLLQPEERPPAAQCRPVVVVISGASSGIGRATAHVRAREGACLVLAARRAELLQEVALECERLGARAIAVPTDVSDAEAVDRLARDAVECFGRIDVWFNNAGVLLLAPFERTPQAAIRQVIETNLLGQLYGAQAALRQFRAQGSGTLINTCSILGLVSEPYVSLYAATKFAIRGLGISLRGELRDTPGIRVCTLLPAAIDTPIYQRVANYTGQQPKALPPVYDPYHVAKAVLSVMRRPRDEVIVGGFGRLVALDARVAPGLVERSIAVIGPRLQFWPAPAPDTSGNLFEPTRDGWRVDGGWSELPLHSAQRLAVGAGLLTALSVAAVMFKLVQDRRRVRRSHAARATG